MQQRLLLFFVDLLYCYNLALMGTVLLGKLLLQLPDQIGLICGGGHGFCF